uniref:Uncharacterized protein n=1 Tax=Anguilla anguilla TaxID=7936 RepID=A0A0E9RII8_ANGAN
MVCFHWPDLYIGGGVTMCCFCV